MTLRLFGAGAACALAMLLFALTTPPAHAKQCVQTWPPGTFKVVDCPPGYQGRATKQSRRHFRESRKARRGVVSDRVSAGVAAAGVAGQTDNDGRTIFAAGEPAGARAAGRAHSSVRLARASQAPRGERVAAEILPHPPGCPRRAFCGCGAAVKVFGAPIRALWLAANWFKFPPASPAPGMVAVRRGHVFVIEAVVSPGRVLAYDANSGRHQTRRHVRSLAGYSVRNPRGA